MMRGIAKTMQKHHAVEVLDEALEASVRLSHRYIPARQLPDKSVSLLDTACARVAISQHAVPAQIDDCRRQIESLETEMAIIDVKPVGVDVAERQQRPRNPWPRSGSAWSCWRRNGRQRVSWLRASSNSSSSFGSNCGRRAEDAEAPAEAGATEEERIALMPRGQ